MKKRLGPDGERESISEDEITATDVDRRSLLGGMGLLAVAIGTAPVVVACGGGGSKVDGNDTGDPIDADPTDPSDSDIGDSDEGDSDPGDPVDND